MRAFFAKQVAPIRVSGVLPIAAESGIRCSAAVEAHHKFGRYCHGLRQSKTFFLDFSRPKCGRISRHGLSSGHFRNRQEPIKLVQQHLTLRVMHRLTGMGVLPDPQAPRRDYCGTIPALRAVAVQRLTSCSSPFGRKTARTWRARVKRRRSISRGVQVTGKAAGCVAIGESWAYGRDTGSIAHGRSAKTALVAFRQTWQPCHAALLTKDGTVQHPLILNV